MANASENYVKNAITQSGGSAAGSFQKNTPVQYADRQRQYYAKRTNAFVKERAKYASDFVRANVQGLLADDFYEYVETDIRLADIASQTATSTSTSSKNIDDIKIILFAEPQIDYFPVGAKIETMGSTWICTNPANISSVCTTATIQRCNASYNSYDYYGNIVTEPIIVEKTAMSSNDNSTPQNLVMMDGYFNVICQLNENTQSLGQNQRLILGSKAYFITGFTDFIQEFTGDYESVHLLRFSIRIEEPTVDDDLINHIANGHNYTFAAEISGATSIAAGQKTQLLAHFVKNGTEVEATEEYPLEWEWISSSPDIATVDENGEVTALAEGVTQITAALKQSSGNVSATFELVVQQAVTTPYVEFIGVTPASIQQFTNATVTAGYYVNGALTDETISWTFTGAREDSYFTTTDGNTVTITCVHADNTPLTVTATVGEYSASTQIVLEGY